MSKADNLKDFLVDLANAIREKKNKTGIINPQDFSAEIKSIETGGGEVESKEYKDVNFFDYEGTILYSYTWEEAQALTEMPPLPDRTNEGLVCQGWNWTYEELQEAGVFADIGAMYITDDGKTKLLISIPTNFRKEVTLGIGQTVANGVIIDWGDGSATETINGTGNVSATHEYAQRGDYTISLEVINGILNLAHQSANTSIKGNPYKEYLNGVYLGYGITQLRNNALSATSLKFITLHNNITDVSTSCLSGCYALHHINIPAKVKSTINQCLKNCHSLVSVSLPFGVTSIGTQSFYGCYMLRSRLCLNNISKIESRAFYQCGALTTVKIPSLVTTIDTETFSGCTGMAYYDFTAHSSAVPTLANIGVFRYIPTDCKIVVPDELVEDWRTADNWANYATYIVGKTEYINGGGTL